MDVVQREFSGRPSDVAAARDFATEVLGRAHPLAGAVVIVVSELTTNAVRHACSPFTVGVYDEQSWVRVQVRDHGPGWSVGPSTSDPESHLGLGVVAALANRWGLVSDREGTFVWAEVDRGT